MTSRWAQEISASTKAFKEKSGRYGAGARAAAGVVDLGGITLDHVAIGLPERQTPDRIPPLGPGLLNCLGKRIVVCEQCREIWPERDPCGTGQRRHVDQKIGFFGRGLSQPASHKTTRPSASVLPISIVMPLRVVITSSGR